MAARRNAVWAEIVQLVPIICLALPFIAVGKVDLSRAGLGFLIGALLTIPISTLVLLRKQLLNPILIGAGLWLWLGAIAFTVPVGPILNWLVRTQALGLFVAAFVIGLAATLVLPQGYVACHSDDSRWIKKASLGLLGLTMVVLCWSWLFRQDVRLGGGLPFIVLNVGRRMLCRRAPLSATAATP